MKILLLGHEDIASLFALNMLVKLCPDQEYSVCWSGELPVSRPVPGRLEALGRFEKKLFDEYLAKPQTSSVFARGTMLTAPNSADGLATLSQASPDLIVSVRYRRILKDDAIAISRLGILNLHSGTLPDYRGVMATFWAMQNGEQYVGTTLHWIVDAGIDTGPVIGTTRESLDLSRSYLENLLAMYPAGCQLIADAITSIHKSETPAGIESNPGAGSYFSAPAAADIEDFVARGYLLHPDDIDDQMRQLSHLIESA